MGQPLRFDSVTEVEEFEWEPDFKRFRSPDVGAERPIGNP